MLVIAEPNNQLANRLFNAGHVMATAIECQTSMLNPAFEGYAEHYPTMSDDALCPFPKRRLPFFRLTPRKQKWAINFIRKAINSLEHGRLHRFHGGRIRVIYSGQISPLETPDGIVRMDTEEFSRLARRTSLLFLSGPLFRNDPAFIRHQETIRDFFTPAPKHLAAAQHVVSLARAKADVVVGVHVRRGDYSTYFNGRFFYSDEIYLRLMRQTAELFPGKRVAFVVCSNEPALPGVFRDLDLHRGPGHLVQDLHCLAECDFLLGPPSTFSGWASFYGKKPLCVIFSAAQQVSLGDFQLVGANPCRLPREGLIER